MRRLLPIVVLAGITATGVFLFQVMGETPKAEKFCGVSWVGGAEVNQHHFKPLLDNHVNWIVQTPFSWMGAHDEPGITMSTQNSYYWGESDVGLRKTTQLAHDQGIKVLLKPHIWMRSSTGKWRSDIQMENEEEWRLWFENYEHFITHYAELAEEMKIEGLCIGTELYHPTTERSEDFTRLIRKIRTIYSGKLIYAANWYQEYEEISFWGELDYIGIQAYFPLGEKLDPNRDDLMGGWQSHLEKIEALSRKYDKPVLFTEVGYRSMKDASIEPWKWPDNRNFSMEDSSPETQAVCYEAMYETFWDKEWFAGTFIWKWYPHLEESDERPVDFTPQYKPAEKVIRKYYQRSSSLSSISMAD